MSIPKNSWRINELAKKWKEGTITPEEKEEFDRWYEGAAGVTGDDADADVTDDTGVTDAADAEESVDLVRERIFLTIAEREGLRQPRRPVIADGVESRGLVARLTASRRSRWLSAAAVVLLLAGGGILYMQLRTGLPSVVVVHPLAGHELPPGSAKATLTLSDGTVVPLQQGKVGTIRDKNGISIRQQRGTLVYEGGSPAGESGLPGQGLPGAKAGGSADAPISYNTITVPRGGQYQLVLSDGTAVWLNSASSLRYPTVFRGGQRTVMLTGEGYFEVAKDKGHVFRVETGSQVIDVLGTQFNINCYPDEADVRTTLLQGSVRVWLPGGPDSLVIRPGQQAEGGAGGNDAEGSRAGESGPGGSGAAGSGRLRVLDNVDIEQVIAWKNGYFQLNDADIRTIMRQVARWYDVEVKYEGTPPVQELSGKMRRSASAAEFLDMLSYFNIRSRIEGRTIIVMAGGGATKAKN